MSIQFLMITLVVLMRFTMQYMELLQSGAVEQFLQQNGISNEQAWQLINSKEGQQLAQKVMRGELSGDQIQTEAQKIVQQSDVWTAKQSSTSTLKMEPSLGQKIAKKIQELSSSQDLMPALEELAEDFLEEVHQVGLAPIVEFIKVQHNHETQPVTEQSPDKESEISGVAMSEKARKHPIVENMDDNQNDGSSQEIVEDIFILIILIVCYVVV